jgi:hypothetical protein
MIPQKKEVTRRFNLSPSHFRAILKSSFMRQPRFLQILASEKFNIKTSIFLWMENRGKAGIPVQQPQPLPGKGFIEAWVELLFFWLSKRYHNAKKKSSTFSKFLRKYFNEPEMCRNLPCSR